MGDWGHGNFDGDTAADHLDSIAGRLYDEVVAAMSGDPVGLEPDQFWGVAVPCNLEILALFAEQGWVGAKVPDVPTLERWRSTYMAIWDDKIRAFGASPSFAEGRRKALLATFARVMAMSVREHGEGLPPARKTVPKRRAKPARNK